MPVSMVMSGAPCSQSSSAPAAEDAALPQQVQQEGGMGGRKGSAQGGKQDCQEKLEAERDSCTDGRDEGLRGSSVDGDGEVEVLQVSGLIEGCAAEECGQIEAGDVILGVLSGDSDGEGGDSRESLMRDLGGVQDAKALEQLLSGPMGTQVTLLLGRPLATLAFATTCVEMKAYRVTLMRAGNAASLARMRRSLSLYLPVRLSVCLPLSLSDLFISHRPDTQGSKGDISTQKPVSPVAAAPRQLSLHPLHLTITSASRRRSGQI